MKTGLLFLSFLITTAAIAQQQGVAITTDGSAPASSAMLDVKSTDKGMLVPRMTTAQRTAIANVVKGLLVFDNTTSSFWFYNGTAWTELSSGGASPWTASGTNVSNTNSGNVGIGTASPTAKLHVSGNVRSTGRIDAEGIIEGTNIRAMGPLYVSGNAVLAGPLLVNNSANVVQNLNSFSSMSISNDAGIFEFKAGTTDKGFVQLSGDDLRIGTHSSNSAGRLVVRTQGANQVAIDNNGLDLSNNGKLTRKATTDADLLPICFGRVGFGATAYWGTPNFTATKVEKGIYEINCSRFNAYTVIVVTMNQYQGGSYTYPVVEHVSGSTKYIIRFYNTSLADYADAGFSFVAYHGVRN